MKPWHFFLLNVAAIVVAAWFIFKSAPIVNEASTESTQYHHLLDSTTTQNYRSLATIDTLQHAILRERAMRDTIDRLTSIIARNPKYHVGTYRDSSTAAKLAHIIGADGR